LHGFISNPNQHLSFVIFVSLVLALMPRFGLDIHVIANKNFAPMSQSG
jgi:hypothetical protein